MRIGAFKLDEPLPDLRDPHAFAVLRPWVDVGGVGSSTIARLESQFNAQPLGRLIRPGNFFDFTRYRPVIRLIEGRREIAVPNTFIKWARQPDASDLVFLHFLEPHMLGEVYVDSVLRVLQRLGVKRYCLVGGMYDAVPHTKPLIVSGIASSEAEGELRQVEVQRSDYEGPTTIVILISQEAPKYNIEVMTLIVHLPQYAQLEEDYAGELRLLEVLCSLYHFPVDLEQVKGKAERQYAQLSLAMEKEPQVKRVVEQLEEYYEARTNRVKEEQPRLSPEIEKFLREIGKGFDQS
ncbi:MAG TPA: PAC2 family protein [Dehalococcoidia bacterium]|nr:PAC2 family protein [Dehalococcoidia bacterium]